MLGLAVARAAFPDEEVGLDEHARTVDMRRADPAWRDATFLIGADQFAGLLGWKEPRELLRLVRLGVATRPGYPPDAFGAILAELDATRVRFFAIEPWPVSSTRLRELLAEGEDVAALVPDAVLGEIARGGLYPRRYTASA